MIQIESPNRTSKFLRSSFQLSQLDGAGMAVLEQQRAEEMKDKLKHYQLQQLAVQNDTDVRTQSAIQQVSQPQLQVQQEPQHIPTQPLPSQVQRGSSSSSGLFSNVAGGIISGASNIAMGALSMLNPFGADPSSPTGSFQTITSPVESSEPSPVIKRGRGRPRKSEQASPVPSGIDDAVEREFADSIFDYLEQEEQRKRKEETARRLVYDDLEEVSQQQNVVLLVAGGLGLSPSSASASASSASASSPGSPPAPTEYYIGDDTPSGSIQSVRSSSKRSKSVQSVKSSPQAVDSSPGAQSIKSSPQSIKSSPQAQSISSSSTGKTKRG